MYGLYLVKLAVALVLIGGVAREDTSGMKVRGQCHLLLIGEPGTFLQFLCHFLMYTGTGKSQFLK